MKTIFCNNISQKSSYKMNIPLTLENKIRFICSESWNTEWSGVLFYTYKGTFENNDLEICCQDICVLDVGTTATTEFDMNQEVINYMTKNNLLDCQMGLVHSHHNMETFFSGTDINTLQTEGESRNNFVSLIVNNKGTYNAAITRKIVMNTGYYNFFDKSDTTSIEHNINIVQAYNLNIVIGDKDYSKLKEVLRQLKQPKVITKLNTSTTFNNKINAPFTLPTTKVEPNKKITTQPVKTSKISLEKTDKKIISLLYQIVTGSVIVTYNSNISIDDWIIKLPEIYKKRFNDIKDFQTWIEWYIDYLLLNINDPYDNNTIIIYTTEILDLLDKYPSNIYLDCIKQTLTTYTLDY